MGAIAQKRGINVIAFGAIEEVELEENAYDIIIFERQLQLYGGPDARAFGVCKKALKPNGKFISLDVPKESAFGFMYLSAKAVGTFRPPSLRGVMPKSAVSARAVLPRACGTRRGKGRRAQNRSASTILTSTRRS